METALCYDSTRRRLRICARETFASDDHIALHVAAELDTKEGHVSARAKLRKRYFPKHLGFHVDVGAEYATDADEIRYGVKGRKKWELSEDGLLSLDFKSKVQFSQMKRKGDACAKLELSQKIFNFTEDQDLKIKVGLDVLRRNVYAQIRENNWTLSTDMRGSWHVSYDL
uniref:Uncharacterized protein n=1 Tax=Picocystis salinarum TaxID=88271 RepID=A0A7S3UDI8_9CHLO|mmetsp:Transcript_3109/g.19163  ORF Transcript_3109/g.19163 Transcript_3109/m.19163 type:complete len:170 (-) Transcript_3109:93-602(-)